MHRTTRWLLATLTVAACLWPVAVSAQVQDAPSADSLLTVDQVRGAFTTGYQVDQVLNWTWTSPPVTSVHVHDLASGRVVMVLVYPSATSGRAGRRQAEAREQAPNADHLPLGSPGPHLVLGYGPSVWNSNVAMVQTSETQLERLSQLQNGCYDGVHVDADVVHDAWYPTVAVDLISNGY